METDGILLSANMKSIYDYESVYLSEGKIFYIFNAGSGALVLSSKNAVNDGKWHKAVISRSKRQGTLIHIRYFFYLNLQSLTRGQPGGLQPFS